MLRTALVVLLAYAVVGAVAGDGLGVGLEPARPDRRSSTSCSSTDYASLRRVFTGTGLYALVGGLASALLALAVTSLTRAAASC